MEPLLDKADLDLLLQHPGQWPNFEGYKAIDKKSRQIRVLYLSRGPRSEIHCAIEHVSLDRSPTYEALSYCWGPPDKQKAVFIDGSSMLIRFSLHQCLDALCDSEQSLPIWLDSICINQRDTEERNWQVSMMSNIYRKAVRVKAWLGPADVYTEYFFAYVRHSQDQAVLASPDLGKVKALAAEGAASLASRPYWHRLWIVQEITLSRSLTIVCGSRTMDWTVFLRSFQQSASSSIRTLTELDDTRKSLIASALSHDIAAGSEQSYGQLEQEVESYASGDMLERPFPAVSPASTLARMTPFRSRACQDFKDKIYAVIGISADGNKVTVDYSKSFSCVLMITILLSYDTWKSWTEMKGIGKPVVQLLDVENFPTDWIESRLAHVPTAKVFMMFVNDAAFYIRWLGELTSKHNDLFFPTDSGACPEFSHQLELHSGPHMISPQEVHILNPDSQSLIKGGVYLSLIMSGWIQVAVSWNGRDPPLILGFNQWEKGKRKEDVPNYLNYLVQTGAMKLCPQVYLRHYPARKLPSCVFVVHYDRAAMLAIICLTAKFRWWEGYRGYFDYKSQTLSSSGPCECAVSVKLNEQAFATYINDMRTRCKESGRGQDMSEEDWLAL